MISVLNELVIGLDFLAKRSVSVSYKSVSYRRDSTVSLIPLKMPKVRLGDQVRALILTRQIFISLKLVVHILFAVKGVFSQRFGTHAVLVQ